MYCPNCKKIVEGESKFCSECGSPLEESNESREYNNVSYVQVENEKKNSGKKWIITSIVLSCTLVVLIAGLFVCGFIMVSQVIRLAIGSIEENLDRNLNVTYDWNEEDNKNESKLQNTETVLFNDYEFKVPKEYTVKIEDNQLCISDENETWYANISVQDKDFIEIMVFMESSLKQELSSLYDIVSSKFFEVGDVDFVSYNGKSGEEYGVIAFCEAEGRKSFMILGQNDKGQYDESILEKIAPIVKYAKYVGDNNET